MFANPRKPALWLALLSAVLILTAGVTACARLQAGPGLSPVPTFGPTAQPVQPTAQPVQPTAQPGQPTAQPVIGFNPKAGGPGTVVDIFGSGYVPGRWYVVRLGTPQPTGEVLFSAQAGADGRWAGKLTLPANLPSGQPIASGQIFLVAMDDQNKALASAPFAFTAAPAAQPYPQTAQELIKRTLDEAFRGGDVRPYVSREMVQAIEAGQSYYELLGLRLADANGYSFGEIYNYPGADVAFVPVTINYYAGPEERIFTVAIYHDDNPPRAKIFGSELAREGRPLAAGPEDAAYKLLLEVWADRSGRRALPYLFGELRERVARGEQVDLLEDGGVGPLLPLYEWDVGNVVAQDDTFRYVQVSLNLNGQRDIVRFVKVREVEGAWRAVAVISSLAGEPPAEFPGAGWTAWKTGDFNGDGYSETVYLKETGAVNYDRLADPLLNSSSLNASAIMVVQTGPQNAYPILEIDSQSARTPDGYGVPFTSPESPDGPAFFQVSLTYAYEGRFLHVLPLKADGYAYAQAMAFKWHPDFAAYRLIGGPFGEW